jgi:uncharacterized protein (TIGR03435 family)
MVRFGRCAVDRTGLSGEFDFDVEFAPERPTSAPSLVL